MTSYEYEAPDGVVHTFGVPDDTPNAGAVESATLICANAGCGRFNRATVVHVDTVQPVMCGGCGGVLLCEHRDMDGRSTYEGTLRNLRRREEYTCRSCKTVVSSTSYPVNVEDVDVRHLLAARHTE